MSYNGTGTFVINSAGTPYVSGTVISSTAANALNADLATGLTTAITKDGQTTPTANIPLGGFKITNLGAGTVASDAARLSQVQNSTTTTLISITGTDTITGTVSPTLTAYATGQVFSFVVAATNTGAVTLNINSLGAQAVTRTGSVALVAGDMVTGQVAIVEYDGTRFQLINGNSFTNLKASGTLGVTGITTVAAGSAAAPSIVSTTGTSDTGEFFPAADTIAWSTAGTERARIDSSGNIGIGTNSPGYKLDVSAASFIAASVSTSYSGAGNIRIADASTTSASAPYIGSAGNNLTFGRLGTAEYARIDSSGNVLIGTTSSGGVGFTVATDASGRILTSNVSVVPFDVYLFKNSGTTVGKITINTSSTAYTTTSDYRLKENVTPLTGALSVVNQLKPVNFTWKLSGESTQGFIAHELQEVVPDCVTGKKDDTHIEEYEISPAVEATFDEQGNELTAAVDAVMGEREAPKYQGVDTSFLVATLTAAIQELKAIIDTQAARITALETI